MKANETSDFSINFQGTEAERISISVYYILANLIAVVENVVLLFVTYKSKKLHNPSMFYVASISCGDLFFSLMLSSFNMSAYFLGRWPGGAVSCAAYGYLTYVIAAQSLITYTLISRDRYAACCKALSYKTSWIYRRYKLFIVAGWVYASAVCSPPLYGWGRYTLEPGTGSCALDWAQLSPLFDSLYTHFLGVSFYYPCTIATVVHYIFVIRGVRKVHPGVAQSSQKREGKVSRTIGIVIFVFNICYAFYVF